MRIRSQGRWGCWGSSYYIYSPPGPAVVNLKRAVRRGETHPHGGGVGMGTGTWHVVQRDLGAAFSIGRSLCTYNSTRKGRQPGSKWSRVSGDESMYVSGTQQGEARYKGTEGRYQSCINLAGGRNLEGDVPTAILHPHPPLIVQHLRDSLVPK